MNRGDKVRVHDGSYAMVQDGKTKATNVSGNVLIAEGDFEIIEISKYPMQTENLTFDHGVGSKKQINDIKLRSLKDQKRIVYTQQRFCSNV